jgi:hypothetical protein
MQLTLAVNIYRLAGGDITEETESQYIEGDTL